MRYFYLYIIAIEDDFANTGYFNHFLDAVDLASVQFHKSSNITLVYAWSPTLIIWGWEWSKA